MTHEQLELPFPQPVLPTTLTAFVVLIGPDGTAVATSDLTLPAITRQANLGDIRRGCMDVVADIAAAQAADAAVERLQAAAQASADQVQSQIIRAKLDDRRMR